MPKIDVLANTTSAQRAVKDLSQEFDKVGDSLEDVARDGDRAGDKIERSFKDLVQDAGRAEKAVKEIGNAADKAGDDAKKGMKKASEGTAEFKDEAKSSAREGAASFTGEFDDVADYIQEVLANALGGFGPAGAAAGIALATILGTALAQTQAAQDKLGEVREGAADLADQLYQDGGVLPLADRVSDLLSLLSGERASRNNFENIANGFLDLGTNLEAAKRSAQALDVPLDRIITGLTGADLRASKDTLAAVRAGLTGISDELRTTNAWDSEPIYERQRALQAMEQELQSVVTKSELANELYSSTEFMNAQRIDDLANAWSNAGVQAGNYFKTGEDGVKSFDVGAYIADWESQIAKADEVKSDLLTLPESIKAEAERQWAAGGVAAADAYVDAYQAADADTKAKLEAIAGPQGQAAGRKAAQGFVDAADARFNGYTLPELNATINLGPIDRAIRNYRPPTINVPGAVSINPGNQMRMSVQ